MEIFDRPVLPETPFVTELAEELFGTLQVIAHAGHEKNIPYIQESQKYFRERYGKFIEHVVSDVAIEHIIPAYECLQRLLEYNLTPEQIRRECEICIEQDLIGGEPDEEYAGIFQEFHATI